jgi:DNA-directed RNA polymerase subunit RPC12/RpoP
LAEFEARFATEEACRDYLYLRWPDGFRCPGCGYGRAWPVRKVWLQCARCGRQTSATVGTIFQDTRRPLRLWFRAMWHVTSQKNGATALGFLFSNESTEERAKRRGQAASQRTCLHKRSTLA